MCTLAPPIYVKGPRSYMVRLLICIYGNVFGLSFLFLLLLFALFRRGQGRVGRRDWHTFLFCCRCAVFSSFLLGCGCGGEGGGPAPLCCRLYWRVIDPHTPRARTHGVPREPEEVLLIKDGSFSFHQPVFFPDRCRSIACLDLLGGRQRTFNVTFP